MILFKKLKWKNILSTGNYFSEINLNKTANTLIVGKNGSGKSTMLDALCFALFGKPFRTVTKSNLLNSINGKESVVEIEFVIGNKNYKIIRGIKPNKFEIYQDDKLINQEAAVRDYQEYLEKFIIKLNYKSFTQIVILGSASFTPFMQLSSSDRRTIIEDLLDIQIFSTMNGLVKNWLSTNKDEINTKKNNLSLLTQKYELKKEYLNKINEDKDQKIKEYEEQIEKNRIKLEQIMTRGATLRQVVSNMEKTLNQIPELEVKIKDYQKMETKLENKLSSIKKNKNFYEHNDSCSTCKQTIAENFKIQEIKKLTTKEKELDDGLKSLKDKLLNEESMLNKLKEKENHVYDIKIQWATSNVSIKGIQSENSKTKKEIENLGNTKYNNVNVDEITELENSITEVKKELSDLINEKEYYEVASGLLKDTGIKTQIIKQYLPIINQLVNKHLSALDFFVNFNLDESFKETIKSRHRDDFTYHSFSEGEKQRIDMALMLTWRAVAKLKNSSNTNLLILDEVFDSSLDTTGTEELMKILHLLDDVNLFVISHKGDILQDKFANTIRFQKIKNFSRISK